jgi:hypothetical protein
VKAGDRVWKETPIYEAGHTGTVDVPVVFVGKTTSGRVVVEHMDGTIEELQSVKGLHG